MLVTLTDGDTTFDTRDIAPADLGWLNEQAQNTTEGELWWEPAAEKPRHGRGAYLRIGDLIGVASGGHRPHHECLNYAIMRYDGDGRAVVLEAVNCPVCCPPESNSEDAVEVGDVMTLNPKLVVPAAEWADGWWKWNRRVKWDIGEQ
jgi:hypothetical protein